MQSNLNGGGDAPSPSTGEEIWQQLAPLLDDALNQLGETDRAALVLRYFENKTAREIAAALRMEEEAAQKRVARALEKLRAIFAKRGVTLTPTDIAGTVEANSVKAAPAGLAVTVMAAAKGTAVGGSTLTLVKGALKIMVWTKAKTIIVGVGILVVAGTGVVIVKSNFLPTDATIRQLVVGSWKPVMPASSRVETSTEMKSDGKFVTKVTTVRTGITNILGYDGSWELKDGYITTQITNITVGDESQLPPRVERVRVVQIDGHQMVMRQDGSRNLNRMERK